MTRLQFSSKRVQVLGRVGRKPDLKQSSKGGDLCHFSVACSDRDRDGNEETTWFDVTAFGKAAEITSAQVEPGDLIYFDGSLQVRPYTTRDGEWRVGLNVAADVVNLIAPWRKDAQPQQSDEGRGGDVVSEDLPWE